MVFLEIYFQSSAKIFHGIFSGATNKRTFSGNVRPSCQLEVSRATLFPTRVTGLPTRVKFL